MKALDALAKIADRIVWSVGCFTILGYSYDHWPRASQIVTITGLAGLGLWYLWRYLVQPFKAGLRGE